MINPLTRKPIWIALAMAAICLDAAAVHAFTPAQRRVAKAAYCHVVHEQSSQLTADVLSGDNSDTPETLMVAVTLRAIERLQSKTGLDTEKAMLLTNDMLKHNPDLGQAHSLLEQISACEN